MNKIKCEYDSCEESADMLVYNRRIGVVQKCCDTHAEEIVNIDNPEYVHTCENCKCRLPIN